MATTNNYHEGAAHVPFDCYITMYCPHAYQPPKSPLFHLQWLPFHS
jgi:hypothetical protein